MRGARAAASGPPCGGCRTLAGDGGRTSRTGRRQREPADNRRGRASSRREDKEPPVRCTLRTRVPAHVPVLFPAPAPVRARVANGRDCAGTSASKDGTMRLQINTLL